MTTWFDELEPASFAGLPFKVRGSADGRFGWQSATETVVDRGSRRRAIAPEPDSYSFEGFLQGATARRDALAFKARALQGPGLLVHPYFGSMDVLCDRITIAFKGPEIEHASLQLEFSASELPAAVAAPAAGLDAASATADIAAAMSGFNEEPGPADELRRTAPALGLPLEPDEDLPERTGQALLSPAGAPRTGVPGAVQGVGAGLRELEAGQLDAAGRDAVADQLLREALRTDSLTLMAIRELWLEAVLAVGPADSRQVDGAGHILPAIAVASGIELADLAAVNRDGARTWFVQGTVQL